jgi:hypothetical protein
MSAAAETAAPVLEARELQRLYPVARGLFKPPPPCMRSTA